MATVHELSEDELSELRGAYFQDISEIDFDSLGGLNEDEIPIETIKKHYEGIHFVKEDFFCNL